MVTALGQGPLPSPQHALAEVEASCGLGQALALLGDELDGLGLELACEGSSCLRHRWTPGFELTLLTRRPPSLGKSTSVFHSFDAPERPEAGPGSSLQIINAVS